MKTSGTAIKKILIPLLFVTTSTPAPAELLPTVSHLTLEVVSLFFWHLHYAPYKNGGGKICLTIFLNIIYNCHIKEKYI